MTNILLGIIALELLAIFSKLDKLEEGSRKHEQRITYRAAYKRARA